MLLVLTFWFSCQSSVQGIAPWLSRKYLGWQSKPSFLQTLFFYSAFPSWEEILNVSHAHHKLCLLFDLCSVKMQTSYGNILSQKLGTWTHLRRWLTILIQKKIPMRTHPKLLLDLRYQAESLFILGGSPNRNCS